MYCQSLISQTPFENSKQFSMISFFSYWELNVTYEPRHAKLGLRTYADSVAPDQPAHRRSLIRELRCPLFYRIRSHWRIRGQCSSQIRLRGCAGWSEATLSAYGKLPSMQRVNLLKPYPAQINICCMPYANSVAPDLPVHLSSMMGELLNLTLSMFSF